MDYVFKNDINHIFITYFKYIAVVWRRKMHKNRYILYKHL